MSQDIYKVLTRCIDQFYAELKGKNIFYQRVLSGHVTVEEFALFIKNVSFLTAQTPEHLEAARQAAEEKGLKTLARFFKAKRLEEADHEKWGEADLAGIQARHLKQKQDPDVLPEMKSFVEANAASIRKDPFLYFVYILFAEYFTVIAGPECLAAVERSTKIPRELMSIIDKHAELDKDHVQDWGKQAKQVGLVQAQEPYYIEALQGVFERYSRFATALSRSRSKAA